MKRMLALFGACLFLGVFPMQAAVIKISNLRAVNSYAIDGALICLCIDETLVFPKESLGKTLWYETRYQQLVQNLSEPLAREQALLEWIGVSMLTTPELTSAEIPTVFSELALSKAAVLGISLCPIALMSRCLFNLETLSLDFTTLLPIRESGWIPQEKTYGKPLDSLALEKNVLFSGIMANGLSMEEVMLAFLLSLEKLPIQIVYVDQDAARLSSAEKASRQLQIPFIGLLYTPAQSRAQHFNIEIANIQKVQLLSRLSDEHYNALLGSFQIKKDSDESQA